MKAVSSPFRRLAGTGRWGKAQVAVVGPKLARAYLLRGNAQRRLKNLDQAIEDLN
jgi:hypothetical protein